MANDEFSKFGFYSNSTHNQNKRNTVYNNALYEDLNFSTTLGANFSTVVGSSLSTTGGLSSGVTLGGKIDLISPWSIKWMRGTAGYGYGYDYDFKNCETQVKWNEGQNIYTYNDKKITNYNYSPKDTGVAEISEAFYVKAVDWCKEKVTSAAYESKKVVSGEMKYGTMMTTATVACTIEAEGPMTLNGLQIVMYSDSTLQLEGVASVTLKTTGTATINGSIIKVG